MTPSNLISSILTFLVMVIPVTDSVAQNSGAAERLRSLVEHSLGTQFAPATCSSLTLGGNHHQASTEPPIKPSILVRKQSLPQKSNAAESFEEPVVHYEETSKPISKIRTAGENASIHESTTVAPTLILPTPTESVVDAPTLELDPEDGRRIPPAELTNIDPPSLDKSTSPNPENGIPIDEKPIVEGPVVNHPIDDEPIVDQPTGDLPPEDMTTHRLPDFQQPASQQMPDSIHAENAAVVIRPPMRQPYRKNQYTFVVENLGSIDASDIKVGISVAESGRIIAALPENTVVSDRTAMVSLEKLAAGDKTQIHLTAVSNDGMPISFATTLSSTSVQKFQAQQFAEPSSFQEMALYDPVSDQSTSSISDDKSPDSQRSSLSSGESKRVAGDPNNSEPVVMKNPFFDNEITEPSMTRQESQGLRVPIIAPPAASRALPSTAPVTPASVSLPTSAEPKHRSRIPVVAANYAVATVISGPKVLERGAMGDYQISVINQTGRTVADVFVNLTIPAGLELVALDPAGRYDTATRSLSWKIPVVHSGRASRLHYRIRPTGNGGSTQMAMLRVNNKLVGHTRFETLTADRLIKR